MKITALILVVMTTFQQPIASVLGCAMVSRNPLSAEAAQPADNDHSCCATSEHDERQQGGGRDDARRCEGCQSCALCLSERPTTSERTTSEAPVFRAQIVGFPAFTVGSISSGDQLSLLPAELHGASPAINSGFRTPLRI